MSRILLTWEMGSNLGHLTRLLPLAKRLKEDGHLVLIAARDVAMASHVFGRWEIPFIQAPVSRFTARFTSPPASYADLLWAQGWHSCEQLLALVCAWQHLFRTFQPDAVIFDYSPTACLASRTSSARRILVGTGFELPPSETPLPAFCEFVGITKEAAAASEERVLHNVNSVMSTLRMPRLGALREIFDDAHAFLTTFAELDHYGSRREALYVGPVNENPESVPIEWPSGYPHRVFAYVRPRTAALTSILRAFSSLDAAIICYAPGVADKFAPMLNDPRVVVSSSPVKLEPLLPGMSLCVSYGSSGIVTSTLSSGVPQLIAPAHVEAQLLANRVQYLGVGAVINGSPDSHATADLLNRTLSTPNYRTKAQAFAHRYRDVKPHVSVNRIVTEIQRLAA